MTKILKKDIVRLCNCIQGLSYQHIKENEIKKEMYIKLLELYESGLNNWIETYNNDHYKTKKERHRLNVHKKLLLELNKVVDR